MNLTGLVSHWALEAASGNEADSHGSNTLTANNSPGSTTGKVGNCRTFVASSSQYFSVASNAGLQPGDFDFEVSAWVFLTNKASARTIIAKVTTTGNQRQFSLIYASAGDRFRFRVSVNGSTPYVAVDANMLGSPSTNTWYYVTGFHDSANDVIGITVNAGAADTTSHTGGVFATGTSPVFVGAEDAGASNQMQGRIDEVSYWKRLLTSAERTELYNSGNGLAYPWGANSTQRRRIAQQSIRSTF